MPPENKNPQPIDPKSLLLPKKEVGPAPDTASRINAGQLLAQEQNATLATPEKQKPVQANGLVEATKTPTRGPLTGQVSVSPAPSTAPASLPTEEKSSVHSLQTYGSDIQKVVEDKNVSVINIAAAEAKRREQTGETAQTPGGEGAAWRTYGMYAGAALLVLSALGLGAFAVLRDTSLPKTPELNAPFITVDNYQLITVPADATRDTINDSLQIARKNSALSLGLVDWIFLSRPAADDAQPVPLTALEFLTTLTSNVPPALQRTLGPTFLLGLHSFDENQPFLLLQADTYTTAYAAMLEWERTMRGDLGPMFVRTPSPKPVVPATPAEPLGTTTLQVEPEPAFVPSSFVDKIVENRDVRALLNAEGDILLLWTMLGRNIILITTNEYTLREVVTRMNVAPTIPQPGK